MTPASDSDPAGPALSPVLVVGLGNPGPEYAGNRHNVGAMVADLLAARMGGRFSRHKSGADVLEGRLSGARVVLAKPRSYMNLSGRATAAAAAFYKIPAAQVIVVHDELDLPPMTIRVKQGGGEGGHNGLRSVSASLGSKDYLRVRFGIGRPPGRQDAASFVLKDFSAAERKDLPIDLEHAADATESLIRIGLLATQNALH